MLRCAALAFRTIRPLAIQYCNAARILTTDFKNYTVCSIKHTTTNSSITKGSLLTNKKILEISSNLNIPVRSVTKFSLNKGKRKTVKAVVKRFFRLHWGGWIRTKVGRHKKLWKKSPANKRRLRQHVFCNATQNTLLDKMVTKYWKRPKYYVEDPYAPYHTREEYRITRRKPVA